MYTADSFCLWWILTVALSQAIQKRDALLRQSEADLLQAREKIRSKAAEAERQAVSARGLEADLQRAKKEKRQREKECASLKTQMLQLREQLKEAHTTCRDTGNTEQNTCRTFMVDCHAVNNCKFPEEIGKKSLECTLN